MLVTEALFVLGLAAVLLSQISDLRRIDLQRDGAEQALELSELLVELVRYNGACQLAASTVAGVDANHAQTCDAYRERFENDFHPHDMHNKSLKHGDSAYAPSHLNELLDQFFEVYTKSSIQLNSARDSYTTGRLLLVHLPELYAYLSLARDEALDVINMRMSPHLLHETQGAVLRIMQQSENTFAALLLADQSTVTASLANRMDLIHERVANYFAAIAQEKFGTATNETYQRDLYQVELADALLEEIMALKFDIARQFQTYLDHDTSQTVENLTLLLILGSLLQLLLLLLFVAVVRSVTHAQSSAAQLRETLHKQDKMFAIIGHELRTPAAAMKMQLDELIQTGSSGPAILELQSTSEHLLDVLDDMRVGSDKSITNEYRSASSFSVYKLCEESIHSLYFMAGRYNVDLFFNASPLSKMESWGYKKQIRQILINLLKNAIIHAEATRVELRLQTSDEAQDKTHFVIHVVDNGKGIPEDQRERLFEAFERGNTEANGSGLGLHVSRELAQHLEAGELDYLPGAEVGSKFRFCFTLENFKSARDGHEGQAALLHGKRILLVEDTPTLLMLGHTILTRAGAVVTDATQGEIGLQTAQEQDFDLIITDIMMPVMDGYEMTRKLRKLGFDKPIIGVTGATVGNEADRLLECGATAVLPKPLTLNNIYAVLNGLSPG